MTYAPNTAAYWNRIREAYELEENEAIRTAPANRCAVDPYFWESAGIVMSPIEQMVWNQARCVGLVLYPQYPIGSFFADFANPAAKIVIECDGKEFHTDAKADMERGRWITSQGWQIFRITGSDCFLGTVVTPESAGAIDRLFLRICSEFPEMTTPAILANLESPKESKDDEEDGEDDFDA